MKKLHLFGLTATLLLTANASFAELYMLKGNANQVNQTCQPVQKIAHSIMLKRQEGISKEAMLNVLGNSSNGSKQLMLSLIESAYQAPLVEDPTKKQALIDNFSRQAFAACSRGFIQDLSNREAYPAKPASKTVKKAPAKTHQGH